MYVISRLIETLNWIHIFTNSFLLISKLYVFFSNNISSNKDLFTFIKNFIKL